MPPSLFLKHLRPTQVHFLRLYAAILRCHRCLPSPMREMGDEFARSEFKQHQISINTAEDGEIMRQFFVEWTKYLNSMIKQVKDSINIQSYSNNNIGNRIIFGADLDMNQVQSMSNDQLQKITEFGQELQRIEH